MAGFFICEVIMTVGVVRSQGSELFFIDTVNFSTGTIVKLVCPTGIQGLGGPRDQIETTCLDTIGDKTYAAGLGNTGQITVPFNMIPRDASHQGLFALKESGEVLDWMIGLSESTEQPGALDSNGDFEPFSTRTAIKFDGYVSDVNLDIATNDIVKGTLLIQRSGSVQFYGYEPA
jgi:hypothetical protein